MARDESDNGAPAENEPPATADAPAPAAASAPGPRPDAEADAKSRARDDDEPTSGRFARLRKRLLEPRELGEDAKHLIGSVLDTSDRAKNEVVKLIAREVRNYLEELKLKDDLRDLLTGHSLEVKASFHLKPLAEKKAEED